MKKFLTFCLLNLFIFGSVALAAPEVKLTPYLNATFTGFCHTRDGFGWGVAGLDVSLFKSGGFTFLNFGVGLAAFSKETTTRARYGYKAWEIRDGKWQIVFHVVDTEQITYKDPYLSLYFKFSPAKVPLNFSKTMKDKVFFEMFIFSQNLKRIDGFGAGLSFSFNVFKKTENPPTGEGDKECENYL